MRVREFIAIAAAIFAAVLLAPTGRAARDPGATRPSTISQELIVLEAPNCIYCQIFRRDVLPSYQKSKRATELPLRFLDLNDPAADHLKLSSSVTIVPTVVLMRDGAEAGRINGYQGPEAFFQSVSRMIATGQ